MKYECQARIPPDATGRSYTEGEIYDLDEAEIAKLTKCGHMGAKYGDQVVEPHFVALPIPPAAAAEDPKGQASLFDDGYEQLTKEQLITVAGELGIAVETKDSREKILEVMRAAKTAKKA
ncbi:MAG TPA: hypothetical protein PLB91_06950 [Spirochaetales bacterium]|nr:hypothetical protein [Spirochaetales bacterium]HRY53000.1 hypothetical protein [Spirochaetia bacterium]